MTKENKKWWRCIFVFLFFFIYIFLGARPIQKETILKPRWISSLESNFPVSIDNYTGDDESELLPFTLGERFGYLGYNGKLVLNQTKKNYLSISRNYWAEYEALPASIRVNNPLNEELLIIGNPKGYPVFLDNCVFLIGDEQNSLTAIDNDGKELWTCYFPAPITCIDAADGNVLAGTLDGAVELINSEGSHVFVPFEPGGSRLSVIMGCAISRDASQLAIISGIDKQRFLLLELSSNPEGEVSRVRSGDTYRVIHHEFLASGFRRPVHISFIDNDSKIAFERSGGLGIYDINSRKTVNISLEGDIEMMENSGTDGFLFLITSQGKDEKRFITIRYPGIIAINAPFKSEDTFLSRSEKKVFLGGGLSMVSFELEKK